MLISFVYIGSHLKSSHILQCLSGVTKKGAMSVGPDALRQSEKCFLTQTWDAVQDGFIFRFQNCCFFSVLAFVLWNL